MISAMLWFSDRFKIAFGEAFDACVVMNRSFIGSWRRYSATLAAIYIGNVMSIRSDGRQGANTVLYVCFLLSTRLNSGASGSASDLGRKTIITRFCKKS